MRFRSEVDLNTGKRFFNPQQDIIDRGIGRYNNSIRRFQDLMAFFCLSYFVSQKEKNEINQIIVGMERLRKILDGNIGYHPDDDRAFPAQDNFHSLTKALQISKGHSVLRMRYNMRCFFYRKDISHHVMMQLKGGAYFQKWQERQGRSK